MEREVSSAAPEAPETAAGGSVIRILVLTDVVSSTRITETLGDVRAAELAAHHDRVARDLLARYGGLEIDKTDGFLLLFERPGDAVAYTLAYHQALDDLSRSEGVELAARAGIHLGEVFLRRNPEGDVARGAKPLEVEGLAKPTAARVMSLAAGRQTLLTHAVFDLARRAAVDGAWAEGQLRWLAHGPYSFKGVEEPLEIYEVGIEGFAPLTEPRDREKAKRAVAFGEEHTLGWRPAAGQAIPRRPSWVLDERVGEGGFGEVWLAKHKTGEKRVFKFCFEAAQLKALKREVTLFRLLKEGLGHRDDIARILDWDFDEAPFFLESEYTAGGNLAEWAAAAGGLAEVPLATRLELVAQVAEALAAAHSVGIVHKDVKPENVLIVAAREGAPRIRLTDFGIGLVTGQEKLQVPGVTVLGFTEVGDPSESSTGGTVRYMAPELLEGKPATAQADVYSLGVMLYQVVVGDFSRTLAPGWKRGVDDEILREDIASLADGSPERRPRHALEVADRLRRLDERRARRAAERQAREAAERAREEAERSRRTRRRLAAVAAAAVLVAAVVAVLAFQAVKAREEADRRRLEAEDLVDFMLFDLRDGLENIGRLDLLGKVAAKAQGYLESQPAAKGSAEASRRRGVALLNTADVLLNQGETARASDGYRAARTIFEDLAARDPDDPEHPLNLATSLTKLGEAEQKAGETTAALASFRAALAVAEELAARQPEEPNVRLAMAQARYRIGTSLNSQDELDGALDSSLAAVASIQGLDPPSEARWRFWKVELESQIQIGNIHSRRMQLEPALAAYLAALSSVERLAAQDPANLNWRGTHAQCLSWIGALHALEGDYTAAGEANRAASALYRELIAEDPSNLKWQQRLGTSLIVMSEVHFLAGDPEAGLASAEQAREILQDLSARDPDDTRPRQLLVYVHLSLGDLADARGQANVALQSYLTARSMHQALRGLDDNARQMTLGFIHVMTGHAYRVLGQEEDARKEWIEAATVLEPLLPGDPPLQVLTGQAWALLALDRLEEAAAILKKIPENGIHDPRLLVLLQEKGLQWP